MKHSEKEAKLKLKALGEHLRKGWKQQYPVKEDQLAKVREAVCAQWDKEQSAKPKKTKNLHKDKPKGQGLDYYY